MFVVAPRNAHRRFCGDVLRLTGTAAHIVADDINVTSERASGPFSDDDTITGYRRPQAS